MPLYSKMVGGEQLDSATKKSLKGESKQLQEARASRAQQLLKEARKETERERSNLRASGSFHRGVASKEP